MHITFFYLVMLPREIWSYITDKNWSLCYYFWSRTTLSQGGDLENVHLFHYLSLWVTRCFIILKALKKPPSLCPLKNYREQFCTDFVFQTVLCCSKCLVLVPACCSLLGSLLPTFLVHQEEGVNAGHAHSVAVVNLAGFPRGTDMAWRVNEEAFKYC